MTYLVKPNDHKRKIDYGLLKCLMIPNQIPSVEKGEIRNGRVSFGDMVKVVCLAFARQFVPNYFFPKEVEFWRWV